MRLIPCVSLFSMLALVASVQAQSMYGVMFRTGGQTSGLNPTLYDINPSTGAATNPRPVNVNDCVGIAIDPVSGVMYGLTDQLGRINNTAGQGGKNLIFTINTDTGAATAVGRVDPSGTFQVFEGDIAFRPTDGSFWGVTTQVNQARLFTIDKTTGLATQGAAILPLTGTDLDISALTFDASGSMYVLDTRYPNNPGPAIIERIDAATGAILQSWDTATTLGNVAGITFGPGGELFIADGDTSGTNRLYRYNLTTSTMTNIGATGAAGGIYQGLAGLAYHCQSVGISGQPAAARTCVTGTSIFTVTPATAGTYSYQWQSRRQGSVDWTNIVEGVNTDPGTSQPAFTAHNVASVSVTMTNSVGSSTAVSGGRREIQVIVSNPCGSATSAIAQWTICPADYNCSGTITVNDIFDFLAGWFAGNPAADFDGASGISVQDIFDFLGAWFAGC